ncbi:pilus assembly protein TadG-related protein [Blastococcus sp. BMG 814]|uniref:Pilus assembly protein TadG-related protein n=1 Tax=Blastococcus carthaginiensis TaxID=3050034 RepID=A0ABT9IIN3_9ACTN|nr:pilus assembly protein TadG-related protein [Blastococcus carthaginiensis]MDP5185441.1 pilus assembly protein TadG-related protein [Blastococcus carthaginiensis]
MQRLTTRLRRRLAGERGASAVVFSLLLVPMLGFTAIAVDIGALYAERARLQVAADAAAIAVAQDCSRGNCGDMLATAQQLISHNDPTGTAAQPVLSSDPLSVTVTGGAPKEHWFAPVIGHDSSQVSATATVGWGAPSQGTAVLPLTFSWCAFEKQTGGGLPDEEAPQVLKLTKTDGAPECHPPSGNQIPGGFGFVRTGSGGCGTASQIDGMLQSDPGESPSAGCEPEDFASYLGQTVLLPIFDEAGGTGSGGWYRVHGYAAFRLTGYSFTGQYKSDPRPCTGNDRCITGYFTRFVELSDDWSYSPDAPQMGASILRLIR